jgi:Cu(I)/Ag(I) efflux system protein CusF
MKRTVALALFFALSGVVPNASHAQPGGMKSMDMKSTDIRGTGNGKKAQRPVHKGVGVVKGVDPVKGTVTLAHDAIKSLRWPAMTMSFTIRDKALFNNFAVGKKVEFEFVEEGKDYVITAVR